MGQNIVFCVEAGVLSPDSRDRLLAKLAGNDRVQLMADEFGCTAAEMATFCLDAGIAFMLTRLQVGDLEGMWFSPAPIADAGWDCVADDPDEADFYRDLCIRMSQALSVTPVVIEHIKLTPVRAVMARDMNAIGNVVAAMLRLGVPFVPEHWPINGAVPCNNTLVDVCESQLRPVLA